MLIFISCFLSPSKSFNRLAKKAEPFLGYATRLTQCANQVLLPNTFGKQYIQRLIAEYQKQQSQFVDRTFKYYQTIKRPFGWLKSLLPGTKAFSARHKLAKNMDVIRRTLSELKTINSVLTRLLKIGGMSGGMPGKTRSNKTIKKQKKLLSAKPQLTTPSLRWDKNNSHNKKGTYRSLFQFFNPRSHIPRLPSDLHHQPRSQP